ncbi:putative C6 transcription factor [Aspergillus clavatus NRRL 1]|uniref:C6 transcription factor, putative n=1 Tax=Aspergillus clavatus (strain ATCC 1007 / CBS 513.65 / DSM 816 / NCTC 3887 / NRRL 1 / QM 1276 / 107) TaxID=344612 RepID=A1CD07_ASPCL|nr:C6 transcription factor, putative [Aspergillus clavatus NRRL 1]EAW12414.1 C6 transcription factor, putative [Aspergillus clavatus NRRL 1]
MSESGRRRRRPAVSCTLCRRRKIRCNRATPCSNCSRSKNSVCVYDNPLTPLRSVLVPGESILQSVPSDIPAGPSRSGLATSPSSHQSTTSLAPASTRASTVVSRTSTQEVELLKQRIQELEKQIREASVRPAQPVVSIPDSNIKTTTSSVAGIFHVHREMGQPPAKTRSTTHKRRTFGQTHWINSIVLFQDIWETTESQLRDETSSAFIGMQKCKALARIIKAQRAPPWPAQPTHHLPPKDVTDELVDCYLRTTETVFRVLHIPTFKRNYEALWVSNGQIDTGFLVQLKLVLTIGACIYDEKYTLQVSALRWVYEAETWLSEPKFKSRLDIQSLQTHILLLIAREIVGIGGDSVWFAAGALLRKAIYLGLHRDPSRLPVESTYVAEMRRRLWNTILEITLQSSLASGGPPLLSIDDFDSQPPAHFDDDQLVAEDPVPKPDHAFTQTSIAIALRKTLPIRLAVLKFLNDLASSGTYDETLQLDATLRASYKDLCRTLQKCNSSAGPSPPRFATHAVDLLLHGYIVALHSPFFGPAMRETSYAFSRKVAVEAALKIWYLASPASSAPSSLARLLTCGSGIFRILTIQAVLLIIAEFRAEVLEDDGLSPLPPRSDLLAVVKAAKEWVFRWIEAGATNIKGFVLTSAITAQIDGLMRGFRQEDLSTVLIKAIEDAEERCLPVLEKMAAEGQSTDIQGALLQTYMDVPLDMSEDWDFMMADVFFSPENMDPMGGGLRSGTMLGHSMC